ncbi:MAG: signal peptidase II [Variibacter sp.]|nr:signal peptidase II [Variibacter sp.]
MRPRRWFGRHTGLGLATAATAGLIDQASKLWLIFAYDLGGRGLVPLAPGLDLVLTWNPGISYGLFPQHTELGRWLLLALQAVAIGLLGLWMARAASRLSAVALGLIVGGAAGNIVDRLLYGAVADFLFFHVDFGTWEFRWYVFNLADAAVVAGVIGLIYESLFARNAAKAP